MRMSQIWIQKGSNCSLTEKNVIIANRFFNELNVILFFGQNGTTFKREPLKWCIFDIFKSEKKAHKYTTLIQSKLVYKFLYTQEAIYLSDNEVF